MSEPASGRSAEEEQQEDEQQEQFEEEEEEQRDEEAGDEADDQQQEDEDEQAGADAAAASSSVSPRGGDAASPAQQSVESSGRVSSRTNGTVRVEDEKPGEESKEESDDVRAPQSHRTDDGGGGERGGRNRETAESGNGDAAEDDEAAADDLRAAAAEQLEELEPESEQGSQTTQQQREDSQEQQQRQQGDDDDDPSHPNGVGTDSYSTRPPERQVYDDDGGSAPDDKQLPDPSAADYEQADRGQFAPEGSSANVPAYVMPAVLKVVINREELEAEADEEEEQILAAQASGLPPPNHFERTPEQVVYVQIIKDNLHHPKPFLGGFRHKYYGTIYHHSTTQTAKKKKKAEKIRFHRETQTIQIISRSQQTNRESGTQMARSDLLQDTNNDKIILSRPYFTADELESLRDNKAKEIQCFLRQCFAWRRVRRLREAKADEVEQQLIIAREKQKKEEIEYKKQIQRRMHPRTKKDFVVLLEELEAWRLHETARIKESVGLTPDEISVALQELLHKEVKLLQTIDRLKITAAQTNKWSRTNANLESMASPKEWHSSEGDLIEVDTPFTTRAKELVDLYNGLLLRGLPRAQRVDILLHVKYTVKEFDCSLSREIVELIRREEDLMRRQRTENSLEGLRRRMSNLFLQFVNTPAFNPEAANFQKIAEPNSLAVIRAAAAAAAAGKPAAGGTGLIAPILGAAGQEPPHAPALSSSLAKPAMLTKNNMVNVTSNVAGRIFAEQTK